MADAILMVVAITVLESHSYISPVRETAEEQLVFFSRAWSRLLVKLRRLSFARQKQFHILDFHSKRSHFDTFAFQLIPTTNDWAAIEAKTVWLRQGSILRNTQLRWVLVVLTAYNGLIQNWIAEVSCSRWPLDLDTENKISRNREIL